MKTRRERANFNFSRGINTDAGLLSFPLNYTKDEENFELTFDGSRRRRKGLTTVVRDDDNLPYYFDTYVYKQFMWNTVGGNPLLHFIVIQTGSELHFYEDVYPITSNKKAFTIALRDYAADIDNLLLIAETPCQVAAGRGALIVVNKHINPIVIEYDEDADTISVTPVSIKERLFVLLDDGVDDVQTRATSTSYNDTYKFNLINQGWTEADIATFFADIGAYPAKNMRHYLGFRRATATNYADDDGVKEFFSDKIDAELFSDAPAPTGHTIYNTFDTLNLVSQTGAVYDYYDRIPGVGNTVSGAGTITITLQKTSHGLTTGDYISLPYYPSYPSGGTPAFNFISFNNGGGIVHAYYFFGEIYQVTVVNANTFTIQLTLSADFVGLIEDTDPSGTGALYAGTILRVAYDSGQVCPVRPSTCAWFAGRAWYSGVDYQEWISKIYFSQVIQSSNQYGKCYQVADPTDPEISDLVATDGGVIQIHEAGKIYKLMPYSTSLLVFAENGVWQIEPGTDGNFSGTGYSVRKITDAGVNSADTAITVEGSLAYWGKESIWTVTTDPREGFIVTNNISLNVIDTLFQEITTKEYARVFYDDLRKRIFWVYPSDAGAPNVIDRALVYDLRFGAFTKWKIYEGSFIVPVVWFVHRDISSSEDYKKICVIGTLESHISLTRLPGLYTFNNTTDFSDNYGPAPGTSSADDKEEQSAYIITGYDVAGAPDKFKYAPIIHTFMKKTETGYVADTPVNVSSLAMQARWDWADNASSGKWGTEQECYRHRRAYVPTSPSDTFDDGQPLVIARNKVRGRGRALHIKFTAGTGKNAHLVGWATNYDLLQGD